jgi:hypothetical protein
MKLPRAVPALLKVVAALLAALAGPLFPNAAAVIAALTKAFDTADAAETLAKTRTKGTVATRDVALTALIAELHAAKAFVQQTANTNPTNAAAIIAGAGMNMRKETTKSKAPFAAKQGATSGIVNLIARAVAVRASYDWEWSADGGKTWSSLPSTLQANTTLTGVAPGTGAQFRFRAVSRAGVSEWSQTVTLLVN